MTESEDSEEGIVSVGSDADAEDLLAEAGRRAAERDKALLDLFATDDLNFARALQADLEKASYRHGKFCEGTFRSLKAIVAGLKPRDESEAILATQMAVIHNATIDQSFRLGLSPDDNDPSEMRKLACTFPKQMEALDRHRAKSGRQGVQNVMVAAIVGDVHQQPLEGARASAPPPALTHSNELPMQLLAEVPKEVDPVKRGPRK